LAHELVNYGFDLVSGGTDNHLMLVDLRNKGTNGWLVAWALDKAGIILNRNSVPFDTNPPFYPSGIRLGTPAVTSCGMKEREMKKIAFWINEVVELVGHEKMPGERVARREFAKSFRRKIVKDKDLRKIKGEVKVMCRKFKVPGLDN